MAYRIALDAKPIKTAHLLQGAQAETLACDYLQANGLRLLTKNYRLRSGEIDLIMQDGSIIVFVEVRYRKNKRYGGALASINTQKQKRIIQTASHYLQYHAPLAQARFDVIAIHHQNELQWLSNAFEAY
jgi:putative endonuclease